MVDCLRTDRGMPIVVRYWLPDSLVTWNRLEDMSEMKAPFFRLIDLFICGVMGKDTLWFQQCCYVEHGLIKEITYLFIC